MGAKLIDQVTDATGLPKNLIGDELKTLVENSGLSLEELSLDDLRLILAEYVQDVLMHAKDKHSGDPHSV